MYMGFRATLKCLDLMYRILLNFVTGSRGIVAHLILLFKFVFVFF